MNDNATASLAAAEEEAPSSQPMREQIDAALEADPERAFALARHGTETDAANPTFWFLCGAILANQLNRPQEAPPYFLKALERDDKDTNTWIALANVYTTLGQHLDAAGAYDHVTRLESANAQAWLNLANSLVAAGETSQAADALARCVHDVPELAANPDIVVTLVSYRIQLGKPTVALSILDSLTAVSLSAPQAATATFMRGRALQALGDHRAAVEAFEKAAPDFPAIAKGPAFYLFQAMSLNELPDSARALEAITLAEKAKAPPLQDDEQGIFLLQKGLALLGTSEAKQALDLFKSALELLPDGILVATCWLHVGIAHAVLNESGDANAAFDRSIELAPAGAVAAHVRILAGFRKALVWSALKDPKKAVDALEPALEEIRTFQPQGLSGAFQVNLLNSRASLLMMLDRSGEVADAFLAAEKSNPDLRKDLTFWNSRINACYVAHRFKEAVEAPPAELENHPLVLVNLGAIQVATGAVDEGRERVQRAAASRDQAGDDALKWAGIGLAELNLYHWQATVDALTKACEANPALKGDSSIMYGLGSALASLERYAEAWESVKGLPDTNEVLQAKAMVLQGLGKIPEALQMMQRVKPPDPGSLPLSVLAYWIAQGSLLLAADRAAEALEAFEKAVPFADDPAAAPVRATVAVGRATALITLNRHDEARDVLTAATAKPPIPDSPRPGAAWWLLGGLFAEKERFEEALRAVDIALSVEQGNPSMLLSKGRTLFNLEDYRQAETIFEQAFERASKDEDRFEALIGSGNTANRMEHYEVAVEKFRKAFLARPGARTDPRLWIGLGAAYRSLGRLQTALRTFLEGWRNDPGARKSVELALGVAAVYLDLGRDRDAIAFLNDAAAKTSEDPRLDLNLGIAFYSSKQTTPAQQAWRRAAKAGSEQAADYLERIPKPAPDPADLMGYWFGGAAPLWRKAVGGALGALLLVVAFLPVIGKDAIHALRWLNTGDNYKMGWITLIALLLVFLAPVLKSISFDVGPVKLEAAAPEVTAKPNFDQLMENFKSPGFAVGPQAGAQSLPRSPASTDIVVMRSSTSLYEV